MQFEDTVEIEGLCPDTSACDAGSWNGHYTNCTHEPSLDPTESRNRPESAVVYIHFTKTYCSPQRTHSMKIVKF